MLKFLVLFFLVSSFVPMGVEAAFEEVSRKCKDQYVHFNDSLRHQETWAMKLFDTWGKFQNGILNGNIYNFGDFDQCLDFKHVTSITDIGTITGKHCMITYTGSPDSSDDDLEVKFEMRVLGILANSQNLSLSTGICIPNTCNLKDVKEIASYVLSKSKLQVTSVLCESADPLPFRIITIAIVIFSTLLLTVIGCTIYELYMKHREKPPCLILVAFSMYTNGKNLFEMKKSESSNSIECLNGLRSLSLLWIIFGHRYFDIFLAPSMNSVAATDKWLGNILSLSHTTFHLSVDTFFVMGGLLVTWSFMQSFDVKQFNVLKIYFHRFLRYTPVLLFLMLFFISFMPYLGSGPIYGETIHSWMHNCHTYWWSTIIHISTYTNIDSLCLNWTWYLSADFQLFVLSPLLVYPAWRWRWKFFAAFPVMILLSKAYIFTISMVYKFLVFVGPLQAQGQFDYDRLIYYPTHARCGPWLVGMTLGFIMYQHRERPHKSMNKYFIRSAWILAISVLFAVVLGHFPFQQANQYSDIPIIINATYNSLFRSAWAIAIAWIIFACHNGSGGVIGWFLGLPHFKPLARMSLSVYLSHRVYQIVSVASIKQPVHLSPFNLLHVFFGDVLISFIVGVVVYLSIEAPFSQLESHLFKRKSGRK